MSKVICDYCGSYIDSTNEKCPNCGAVNSGFQRAASDTPQTIEELKSWYASKNLPPEDVTRFFIGKNVSEARAFGIYKNENGDYVVYKNKADGSRAVRYEGKDEAYAVNEIFLKLQAEILQQKQRKQTASGTKGPVPAQKDFVSELLSSAIILFIATLVTGMIFGFRTGTVFMYIVSIVWLFLNIKNRRNVVKPIIAIIIYSIIIANFSPLPQGNYYQSNDVIYYNVLDDWYYYDTGTTTWNTYDSVPDSYYDYNWDSSSGYTPFEDSDYYDQYDYGWRSGNEFDSSGSGADWDWGNDDYDWDFGSDWDSDWGSDWDSDW